MARSTWKVLGQPLAPCFELGAPSYTWAVLAFGQKPRPLSPVLQDWSSLGPLAITSGPANTVESCHKGVWALPNYTLTSQNADCRDSLTPLQCVPNTLPLQQRLRVPTLGEQQFQETWHSVPTKHSNNSLVCGSGLLEFAHNAERRAREPVMGG